MALTARCLVVIGAYKLKGSFCEFLGEPSHSKQFLISEKINVISCFEKLYNCSCECLWLRLLLLKNDCFQFLMYRATFYRWGGQIYNLLVCNFLKIPCTKNYWNRFIFDWVLVSYSRNNRVVFSGPRCKDLVYCIFIQKDISANLNVEMSICEFSGRQWSKRDLKKSSSIWTEQLIIVLRAGDI